MKTLIIVDVQHDFLPGGALGIPGSDAIIPVINRILPKFEHVFATQDWHPPKHVSFASLWPEHCIQNSYGAELSVALHQDQIEEVFQKGTDLNIDSYSAFFDNERKRSTGLADVLRKKHLKELYFVGLATDYCVLYSVLDAIQLGFQTWVIKDACRGIGDEEKALRTMQSKGARIILSTHI